MKTKVNISSNFNLNSSGKNTKIVINGKEYTPDEIRAKYKEIYSTLTKDSNQNNIPDFFEKFAGGVGKQKIIIGDKTISSDQIPSFLKPFLAKAITNVKFPTPEELNVEEIKVHNNRIDVPVVEEVSKQANTSTTPKPISNIDPITVAKIALFLAALVVGYFVFLK